MRLVIRADGSPSIGYGHLYRCMALVEEAERSGIETVVVSGPDPVAESVVRAFGHGLRPAGTDWSWLSDAGAGDFVIFDGYVFGATDVAAARERGCAVAVIDDFGDGHWDVDLVLNPSSTSASYRVPPSTTTLLGPRYALVRSAFSPAPRPAPRPPSTLLVTFGASDASGLAEPVARAALARRLFDRILVIRGPAAPPFPSQSGVEVVQNPPNLAELLGKATAAISAAGSSTWELLRMGVPTALVQAAANQAPVLRTVEEAGAALVIAGDGLEHAVGSAVEQLADLATQARLRSAALRTVDGRGPVRVVEILSDIHAATSLGISFRPATSHDARRFWLWRNDEGARAASFDQAPIPWDRHLEWFQTSLADPERHFAVVEQNSRTWGYVRFEHTGQDVWTVSLALDTAVQGRGWAGPVLRGSRSWLIGRARVRQVLAEVRRDNLRSSRAFRSAGWDIQREEADRVELGWSTP